ncbi:hypothetical protein AB205_0140350 [Aquarana catesbeiana]|uniref:Uncharacterized protein n=1 Tax=Aquarana catesbeiana TaxID=8400 RepID=A0A2G9RJQ6_AQUCT|nr:hypothetical protein AB205_0140350 [Aquarana catesbeiana]
MDSSVSRLSQEVQSVSESIQECLSSTQMPASVKLLQKILGRPLPFKEASVVQCMDKLKALSTSLNVVDLRPAKGESSGQRDFYRLKAASSDWETKHKLLQEWTSILRANHQEDVNTERLSVSVEILRSHMKEQKIPLFPEEKSNEQSYTPMDQKELAQLSSEVQMWPSMEYLMLLWQYKLVTDLLSHSYYVRKNMQSDLNQLVSFCLKHTSLPSQHVRAFNFLTQHSEITSGDVALLWSELICCVFSSFWDSTVSTDPDYWLSWKPTSSPDGSTTQVLLEPSVKVKLWDFIQYLFSSIITS